VTNYSISFIKINNSGNYFCQCCFTCAIRSNKSNFLTTINLKFSILKNSVASIGFCNILKLDIYSSALRRFRKSDIYFGFILRQFNQLKLFKLLYSALNLFGFCIFISEALNKPLCIFKFSLLLFIKLNCLFIPFLFVLNIRIIITAV
jgi:hypothetical protein